MSTVTVCGDKPHQIKGKNKMFGDGQGRGNRLMGLTFSPELSFLGRALPLTMTRKHV